MLYQRGDPANRVRGVGLARRGRLRRNGARTKSGRLRLQVAPPDRGTPELIAKRLALTGKPDDRLAAHALGILYRNFEISGPSLSAGLRYAALYRAAVRPPAVRSLLSHLIVSDVSIGVDLGEGDDTPHQGRAAPAGCRCAQCLRVQYLEVRRVLSRAGAAAAAAVDAVAVFDQLPLFPQRLRDLRTGLDRLAEHFEHVEKIAPMAERTVTESRSLGPACP